METQEAQPVQEPVKTINKNKTWPYIAGACAVVTLGVVAAWLISSKLMGGGVAGVAPGAKSTSTEAGMLDPKTKYDNATGNLKDGGIGNEGTHHLERDGGPSHYVYLTSSVVDLSGFVGKKVEIWGQTLASKKAGWLMDVAKIQVVQ
jgi:hypothetical protein